MGAKRNGIPWLERPRAQTNLSEGKFVQCAANIVDVMWQCFATLKNRVESVVLSWHFLLWLVVRLWVVLFLESLHSKVSKSKTSLGV